MKKILKRSLALLLILIFTLGSVWAVDRVLLIKRYDGVQPMESFYAQEPGTVDVLLMGNSHMGVHVDTATLWREYGISAFALWGGVQPMWNTYHFLAEALKYQQPKAVVLEIGGLSVEDEYSDEATQLKNVAGMHLSLNKLEAVKATAPRERWASLLLGLPLYHQRYSELTEEDFQYFPWSGELINNKGSYALYGHGDFDMEDPWAIETTAEISEKSLDYFMRIVSLCREQGIRLILVKTPTVDLEKYQPYSNAVSEMAEELGLDFYDFNKMGEYTGIEGGDFYFDTHLNLSGARKLSLCMGEILLDTVPLDDHRGDAAYSSWNVNAENIDDGYLLDITLAEDYISELLRGGRAVLLIKNGDWEKREPYLSFAQELSELGVPLEELLAEDSGAWLMEDGAAGEAGEMGLDFLLDGKSYTVDFEDANAVTENGSIIYSFRDIGITLLVYDYSCGKILDAVDFLHTEGFALSRK